MKHFILPIALGLALVSCNRDNDNATTAENPILPIKIVETDEVREIKYSGDKMSEIILRGKDYTERGVVQYEGDLISSITFYDTKTKALSMKSVFTYKNGKLVSAKHSEMDYPYNTETSTTQFYVYNEDGTVTETYKSNLGNNDANSISTITIKDGNFVKNVEINPLSSDKTTYIYRYDTKNNPFKNVKGMSALVLNDYITGSQNNILERVKINSYETNKTTYSYDYNANNFPTKSTMTTSDGGKEVVTYTYNK